MTRITRPPTSPVSSAPAQSSTPSSKPGATSTSGAWSAVGATKAKTSDTPASVKQLATDFYAAFARRDAQAMGTAYDPSVTFHDPLFGTLNGSNQVMEMWKTIMPAANPKTFSIEPKIMGEPKARPDGSFEVKVHWDAHYDLGTRHVDNHSDTTLLVKNGKIIGQRDEWDLGQWTKQALPFGGGSKLGNAFAGFAAHSFIEVKDMLNRGHW